MKNIIVIFLLLIVATLRAQDMGGMKMPKQENTKQTETYTCVMHPEIHSSKLRIGLETAGSDGMAMLSNTRNTIATAWHLGLHPEHGYESETTIGRYLGRMQWWRPFIGYDYHYKKVGPDGEEIKKGIMGKTSLGMINTICLVSEAIKITAAQLLRVFNTCCQ